MVDYTTSNQSKYCFSYADATYECVGAPAFNLATLLKPKNRPMPSTTLLYTPNSQVSNVVKPNYPPYMPANKNNVNLLPMENGLKPADVVRGPPPTEPNYWPNENQPTPPSMTKTKEGFTREDFSEAVKESKSCVPWQFFTDFDKICQSNYGADWIYQGFSQTACGPGQSLINCKQNKLTKSSAPGYMLNHPGRASSYDQVATFNTRPVSYTKYSTPEQSRGGIADTSNMDVKMSDCVPYNLCDYEICRQTFGEGYAFTGKTTSICQPGYAKAVCARKN